jgi:hypothetical protein
MVLGEMPTTQKIFGLARPAAGVTADDMAGEPSHEP